jgi:hypothetical protein
VGIENLQLGRPTETTLELLDIDRQGEPTEANASRLFDAPLTSEANSEHMEVDEEELTPHIVTKQDSQNEANMDTDDEDMPFETPLARQSRNRAAQLPVDIKLTDKSEEEVMLKVGKQKKTAEKERAGKA